MRNLLMLVGASFCLMAYVAMVAAADEPTTARGYYERAGKHENNKRYAEAVADLSKAIELDPKFVDAYFSRSSLYYQQPSLDKAAYAKAVADLTKALDIEPKRFSFRFNRALYYESLREYDKAIADYSEVISGDTDFSRNGNGKEDCLARAHHYRGRAYQWYKSDYAKAVADYTEALLLDPKVEMVIFRRGQAYHGLKEFGKAQDDFAVALERNPDNANILEYWAWQLATCPDRKYRDGKKAVKYATMAHEKSRGQSPGSLGILAAAYAEAGQFDEAVKMQRKGIELLGPTANEQRKTMQATLKLYEAGKPFRTE
ncbi:MAG: tetratricopeptide repeat protein [Gemmataceae bacterium]|nr:tetratricopeptide repeat protein [Gemmataceae bacterium]